MCLSFPKRFIAVPSFTLLFARFCWEKEHVSERGKLRCRAVCSTNMAHPNGWSRFQFSCFLRKRKMFVVLLSIANNNNNTLDISCVVHFSSFLLMNPTFLKNYSLSDVVLVFLIWIISSKVSHKIRRCKLYMFVEELCNLSNKPWLLCWIHLHKCLTFYSELEQN